MVYFVLVVLTAVAAVALAVVLEPTFPRWIILAVAVGIVGGLTAIVYSLLRGI